MATEHDDPPMLSEAQWAGTLKRARADVAAGRVVTLDLDALCDEIDAEAGAASAPPRRRPAPSAA